MKWASHLEVSYCTNVHPGEGLDALHKIIAQDLTEVKSRVSPDDSFGTGLRLGVESVDALSEPHQLHRFCQALIERDLYVFSVNGFPYGDFAAPQIKASVYDPDWAETERARYTIALAKLMAHLPGPQHRSISTVAGGFEPERSGDSSRSQTDRMRAFTHNFGAVAQALYELEEETGVSVRIALEPEPWTSLERVEQVGPFFERYVWPSSPHAQRYWGLCYDTCHQALAFEDPYDSWETLRRAQVPIFKVQVSNALRLTNPRIPEARARLLSFAEPRYLHQVTGLGPEGDLLRVLDLPKLQDPPDSWLASREWRCHFHVPIWWVGGAETLTSQPLTMTSTSSTGLSPTQETEGLTTTRDFWEGIVELIRSPDAQRHTSPETPLHVEVETYSWGVLPASLRQGRTLSDDIVAELDTLRAHLLPRSLKR